MSNGLCSSTFSNMFSNTFSTVIRPSVKESQQLCNIHQAMHVLLGHQFQSFWLLAIQGQLRYDTSTETILFLLQGKNCLKGIAFSCHADYRRQQQGSAANPAMVELMENSIPQTTTLFNRMYKRGPMSSSCSTSSNGTKTSSAARHKVRLSCFKDSKFNLAKAGVILLPRRRAFEVADDVINMKSLYVIRARNTKERPWSLHFCCTSHVADLATRCNRVAGGATSFLQEGSLQSKTFHLEHTALDTM